MPDQDKPRNSELPHYFVEKVKSVRAKRAKTVIDHILEYGFITTEQLSEKYGYDHPPRAIRDVRELGIPVKTFYVIGSHGRKIAAYKFGDPSEVRKGKFEGRKALPKSLKEELARLYGSRCAICYATYEIRYLQVDHRIPYEVGGEPRDDRDPSNYMLLCGSCNRAKSWSCENCRNWTKDHDTGVCRSCYWATPDEYTHVALQLVRHLEVTWSGDEVPEHEQLVQLSKHAQVKLPEFVKNVLRSALDSRRSPEETPQEDYWIEDE